MKSISSFTAASAKRDSLISRNFASPVRKDRPVTFALPAIEATADVVKASAALLEAVASGELTPSEAAELGKLVEAHVRAIEATEFEERLKRLEGQRP